MPVGALQGITFDRVDPKYFEGLFLRELARKTNEARQAGVPLVIDVFDNGTVGAVASRDGVPQSATEIAAQRTQAEEMARLRKEVKDACDRYMASLRGLSVAFAELDLELRKMNFEIWNKDAFHDQASVVVAGAGLLLAAFAAGPVLVVGTVATVVAGGINSASRKAEASAADHLAAQREGIGSELLTNAGEQALKAVPRAGAALSAAAGPVVTVASAAYEVVSTVPGSVGYELASPTKTALLDLRSQVAKLCHEGQITQQRQLELGTKISDVQRARKEHEDALADAIEKARALAQLRATWSQPRA